MTRQERQEREQLAQVLDTLLKFAIAFEQPLEPRVDHNVRPMPLPKPATPRRAAA